MRTESFSKNISPAASFAKTRTTWYSSTKSASAKAVLKRSRKIFDLPTQAYSQTPRIIPSFANAGMSGVVTFKVDSPFILFLQIKIKKALAEQAQI
jgi:hypothetical protein